MTVRLDFASEVFFRDPPKAIATLRMSGPVVATRFPIVGDVWITTTHDATAQVLKDGATFTLRKEDGDVAGLRWWMPRYVRTIANNMLTMDEPDHTRLRSIVDEAFRRRAIVAMEPRIRAIADTLADELFAAGSPADLVQRYARILPLAVISELLGLPPADRPKFIAWANEMSSLTNVVSFFRLLFAFRKMRVYLRQQLQIARVKGGEGLIAELVQVEREGGQITPDEMVSMVFLLLAAGSETTTHLISGSVYELLRNPGLRDWLEQDWSRVGLAVEEFLRFVSPVQFSKPRYVRRDVEVEGVCLKKGDRVMVMLAAANMDPAVHDCPERLDSSASRTVIFHSALESISASAISLRASRQPARWKRCSCDGRNSVLPSIPPRSIGAGGRACARSRNFPSRLRAVEHRSARERALGVPSPRRVEIRALRKISAARDQSGTVCRWTCCLLDARQRIPWPCISQIDVLTGDKIVTSKMPPVPPDNQSRKGTGDSKQTSADQAPHGQQRAQNPDQQGQQGNIKQNTTNQGYQQDR